MRPLWRGRWMIALIGAAALGACAGPDGLACDAPGVTIEPIGLASWRMTTPVVFSAPHGGGEQLLMTATSIFPAPLWGVEPGGVIVAGNPSPGSFETYVEERVAELGYRTGPVFSSEDFSGGSAIYIVFLLLPAEGALEGTSSDSPDADAPIIPHRNYGFDSTGRVLRDCEVFDPNRDFRWEDPPPSAEMYEGQSRIPVLLIDAYEFRLPESDALPPGTYLHEQTLTDSVNAGYRFRVQFEVE
ncbi:MAG: hypothetical protein KC619_25590 [Myxococcales bacterium]|nr:hypothetical protein [Myxococcales bacterium]